MPSANTGSGGGGPWGGGGPSGGGGGGGGPRPPDLEDFIRKGQDRFKGFFPGGGMPGGRGFIIILAILVLLWLASGFYTVKTNEVGMVLRFGKFVTQTEPGLNWHYPWPIETVDLPPVTDIHVIQIGFLTPGGEEEEAETNGYLHGTAQWILVPRCNGFGIRPRAGF